MMRPAAVLRIGCVAALASLLAGCFLRAGFDPAKDSRFTYVHTINTPDVTVYRSERLLSVDEIGPAIDELKAKDAEGTRILNLAYDAIKVGLVDPDVLGNQPLYDWIESLPSIGTPENLSKIKLPWPKNDPKAISLALVRLNDVIGREVGTRLGYDVISRLERSLVASAKRDGSAFYQMKPADRSELFTYCFTAFEDLLKYMDSPEFKQEYSSLISAIEKRINSFTKYGLQRLQKPYRDDKGNSGIDTVSLNLRFYRFAHAGKDYGIVFNGSGQIAEYYTLPNQAYAIRARRADSNTNGCPANMAESACSSNTLHSADMIPATFEAPGASYYYIFPAEGAVTAKPTAGVDKPGPRETASRRSIVAPKAPTVYYRRFDGYVNVEDIIRMGRTGYTKVSDTAKGTGAAVAAEAKRTTRAVKDEIKSEARSLLPWWLGGR